MGWWHRWRAVFAGAQKTLTRRVGGRKSLMALEVEAFSGMRSGVANPGWSPTNAAFFIYALRAMYGDEFGWPQIEEFKTLNHIEDWEPRDDLSADGLLLSGTIYTPDGFDLKGWADYYPDWKAGRGEVGLPDEIEIEAESWTPEIIGWNPAPSQPAQQTTAQQTSAVATVANTAQTATATTQPPKKPTSQGVPGWVWVAGGVGGLALLSMVLGKKGRR